MPPKNTPTSDSISSLPSLFTPPTLRHYLLHYRLSFNVANREPTGKTTERKGGEPHARELEKLEIWKDFGSTTFNRAYLKEILDFPLEDTHRGVLTPPPDLLEEELCVFDELCFEYIVKAHINHVLNRALIIGVEISQIKRPNDNDKKLAVISMIGSHARRIPGGKPDWCTVRRGISDRNKRQSLLPGDTKFEKTYVMIPWGYTSDNASAGTPTRRRGEPLNSSSQQHRRVDSSEDRIMSWIKQVFGYSVEHNTRYSYIITPVRLMICRRVLDEASANPSPMRARGNDLRPESAMPRNYEESNTTPPPSSQRSNHSEFEPTPNAARHEACFQIFEHFFDQDKDGAGAGDEDEDIEVDEEGGINVNIAFWAIHMVAALGETKVKALSEYKKEDLSF